MEDKNRWKWFVLLASVLPWIILLYNPSESLIFYMWVIMSPLWTIIIVISTIRLYELFREGGA